MNDFMHYIDRASGRELVGTFAEKVATANDEVAQLRQAIALGDEARAIAATIRLRHAVEILERAAVAVGVGQADQHEIAADVLRGVQAAAYPLLDRVPTQLAGIVATRRFLARFNVATLDHLRGSDGFVDDVDAEGATLLRVQAIAAAMRRADFRCCLAEHSDFSRANLEQSNWRDATVFWSAFSGAVLTDILCDDALFVDCDLRGADLSAVNFGSLATSVGARFVRCDLRETRWGQRDLGGVSFIDCRMHGVMGQALATDATIVRPDLSARGDGSALGTAHDVIDLWARQ